MVMTRYSGSWLSSNAGVIMMMMMMMYKTYNNREAGELITVHVRLHSTRSLELGA